MWSTVRKALDTLSMKALRQRLNKRRLQEEIDTHRLFFLTEYNRMSEAASAMPVEDIVGQLEHDGEILGFEGQKSAVQSNVGTQVSHIAGILATVLRGDPALPAPRLRKKKEAVPSPPMPRGKVSGLAMAAGMSPSEPDDAADEEGAGGGGSAAEPVGRGMTLAEVSAALKRKLGYTLHLGDSGAGQEGQAGLGLFVEGVAPLGAVIAIYPGVVYSPMQYRAIPGYPKVDRENHYLMARFDGHVLDAKPWGQGGEDASPCAGTGVSKRSLGLGEAVAVAGGGGASGCGGGGGEAGREWGCVERRNPLALAHFANHPGEGQDPNVLVCGYEFDVDADPPGRIEELVGVGATGAGALPTLRAFLPNLVYGKDPECGGEGGGGGGGGGGAEGAGGGGQGEEAGGGEGARTIPTLVLVANRPIQDEEVLLNYRLSPHLHRPDWYHPVDVKEEEGRWA